MARYDVTHELAEVIKSTRIQNHVPSKELAEHIGKSRSYMSKLEKGDIKSIDESELTTIFKFIFNNDSDFQNFLNTTLAKILDTLELRLSNREIDEQLWFSNYDTVLRLIPIPEDIVDDINNRLILSNISINTLCDRINANEGIHPQVTNTDPYPFNEWQAFVENHQVKFSFIKMKVDISQITEILNKTRKSANYVTILSIAYYLLKMERYQSKIDITSEQSNDIMSSAIQYLNTYKFYSLAEKSKLKSQTKTKAEFEGLLSSFDKDNIELINEIIISFKISSELNLSKTNEYLRDFVKNLKWDNGFMMRIISAQFDKNNNMSFSLKKQMLSEIQDIIHKYNTLPIEQKNIEIYD